MSDNRWADLLDEQYLGMIERIAEAEERQVELLEQLVEQQQEPDDDDDDDEGRGRGDADPVVFTDPTGRHQDRITAEFDLSKSEAKVALGIAEGWGYDEPGTRSDPIELANRLVGDLPITYQQAGELYRNLRDHGFLPGATCEDVADADADVDPDTERLDEMSRLFGVTRTEGRAALRMIRKFDPPTSKAEADRHTRLLDKTLDIPTPTLASIYSYCQYHRLLGQSTSDTDPGGGA